MGARAQHLGGKGARANQECNDTHVQGGVVRSVAVHTALVSTLDEALRDVIKEAVAAGLEGPLKDLRSAVETAARIAQNGAAIRSDPELARLAQLEYLTADEAAKLLRIGRDRIYKLVNAGVLRCTRFGKKQIFSRAELDRFMALHEHHAPEEMTPSVRRRLAKAS